MAHPPGGVKRRHVQKCTIGTDCTFQDLRSVRRASRGKRQHPLEQGTDFSPHGGCDRKRRQFSRPTTHRLIELFEPFQRHELRTDGGGPQTMVTELTTAQHQVIELLGMSPDEYGR